MSEVTIKIYVNGNEVPTAPEPATPTGTVELVDDAMKVLEGIIDAHSSRKYGQMDVRLLALKHKLERLKQPYNAHSAT